MRIVQKRKFKNLTTLDQVMPFCGHCEQCGVCDHHIPLGKIGLKKDQTSRKTATFSFTTNYCILVGLIIISCLPLPFLVILFFLRNLKFSTFTAKYSSRNNFQGFATKSEKWKFEFLSLTQAFFWFFCVFVCTRSAAILRLDGPWNQLVIQLWILVACPNPYISFLSGT